MEKSNNFDVKSNEELFKQALVEGLNRRFDREIEEAKKIEEMRKDLIEVFNEAYEKRRIITADFTAEKMLGKGYRKQSEGEWIWHDIMKKML